MLGKWQMANGTYNGSEFNTLRKTCFEHKGFGMYYLFWTEKFLIVRSVITQDLCFYSDECLSLLFAAFLFFLLLDFPFQGGRLLGGWALHGHIGRDGHVCVQHWCLTRRHLSAKMDVNSMKTQEIALTRRPACWTEDAILVPQPLADHPSQCLHTFAQEIIWRRATCQTYLGSSSECSGVIWRVQ